MSAGKIITVRGEIDASELGFCQPHEHLCIERGPAAKANPALLIDDPKKTAVDVRAFKAAGGSAIADATPAFTGRNAETLRWISDECDVHIIATTGFHKMFYYGEGNPFLGLSEVALTDIFVSEIEDGMYAEPFYPVADSAGTDACLSRTDIRAGLIKAALEPEFTEIHAKLFAAAARAFAQTGAAIMIHVDKGSDPEALLKYMAGKGVAPEKLIFCHLDRAEPDLGVHKRLAAQGAYIEYDTIARPKYHDDETEAEIVREMIAAGYADRLMLSLDVTRDRLCGYGGSPGLDYLLTLSYPYLHLIANPAEALALTSN